MEGDASRFTPPHHNLIDIRVADDLTAIGFEGFRNGVRNSPHTAPCKAPGSNVAVHIAHVVMQQHVGSARRVDAEGGPNDTTARHVGFNHIGFKILTKVVANTFGPKGDRVRKTGFTHV